MKQFPSTTKRDRTVDIMKCIGIIAVIVGHITSVGQQFLFSWHMPLFFILAGYFYHQRNAKDQVCKDILHLLLPYVYTCSAIIVFYAVMSLIQGQDLVTRRVMASLYASGSVGHTSKYLSKVPAIGAIWFLWALFWCKSFFNMIYRKCCNYYLPVCLVLSITAVLLDRYLVNLPLAFLPGISALIFYAIGYKVQEIGGFKSINIWIVAVCLMSWIVSFCFCRMSMVKCFYSNFPINVIGSCGGTYFIWMVSKYIATLKMGIVQFIEWIGRHSLTFLCIHLFELDIHLNDYMHLKSIIRIPFIIALCAIGTYLLSLLNNNRKVMSCITTTSSL